MFRAAVTIITRLTVCLLLFVAVGYSPKSHANPTSGATGTCSRQNPNSNLGSMSFAACEAHRYAYWNPTRPDISGATAWTFNAPTTVTIYGVWAWSNPNTANRYRWEQSGACPAGTTFNSATGDCEAPPSCDATSALASYTGGLANPLVTTITHNKPIMVTAGVTYNYVCYANCLVKKAIVIEAINETYTTVDLKDTQTSSVEATSCTTIPANTSNLYEGWYPVSAPPGEGGEGGTGGGAGTGEAGQPGESSGPGAGGAGGEGGQSGGGGSGGTGGTGGLAGGGGTGGGSGTGGNGGSGGGGGSGGSGGAGGRGGAGGAGGPGGAGGAGGAGGKGADAVCGGPLLPPCQTRLSTAASASGDCAVEPTFTGDLLAGAQLRQQWFIMCALEELEGDCEAPEVEGEDGSCSCPEGETCEGEELTGEDLAGQLDAEGLDNADDLDGLLEEDAESVDLTIANILDGALSGNMPAFTRSVPTVIETPFGDVEVPLICEGFAFLKILLWLGAFWEAGLILFRAISGDKG